METTEEQEPEPRDRRLMLIGAVGAIATTGVVVGAVLVTRSPQSGARVVELATRTNGLFRRSFTGAVATAAKSARSLEQADLVDTGIRVADQLVNGHTKMQAYGPKWSMHRLVSIAPYVRAAPGAA